MSLDLIRNATKDELRDAEWLEAAILEMGIYPAQEIPRHLWKTGGLGICQHPNQFAPYLVEIGKLGIKSYAEIGIWVGGTFSVTVEYLTRFGLKRAIGIDIDVKPEVRAYAESNRIVTLLEAPSTAPEAKKALEAAKPDLVLVDGDHTEEGCRADWKFAKSLAPWVAIHDIVGVGYPGVGTVWEEIDLPKQEWTAQYDESPEPQNGMGLVRCATA